MNHVSIAMRFRHIKPSSITTSNTHIPKSTHSSVFSLWYCGFGGVGGDEHCHLGQLPRKQKLWGFISQYFFKNRTLFLP